MSTDYSQMSQDERRALAESYQARVHATVGRGAGLSLPTVDAVRSAIKEAEAAFAAGTATSPQVALLARRDALEARQRSRRLGRREGSDD